MLYATFTSLVRTSIRLLIDLQLLPVYACSSNGTPSLPVAYQFQPIPSININAFLDLVRVANPEALPFRINPLPKLADITFFHTLA
jgi:hypothetical protein